MTNVSHDFRNPRPNASRQQHQLTHGDTCAIHLNNAAQSLIPCSGRQRWTHTVVSRNLDQIAWIDRRTQHINAGLPILQDRLRFFHHFEHFDRVAKLFIDRFFHHAVLGLFEPTMPTAITGYHPKPDVTFFSHLTQKDRTQRSGPVLGGARFNPNVRRELFRTSNDSRQIP